MTATETPKDIVPKVPDPSLDWLPYVAPLVAFMVLTAFEGLLPLDGEKTHPTYYPILYGIKLVIVSIVAWMSRAAWVDLKPLPCPKELAVAILLGLFVTIQWVGLELVVTKGLEIAGLDGAVTKLAASMKWFPSPFGASGSRSAFDPGVYSTGGKVAYLIMRFIGLVALVPLIEELFWRSFMWRWVIDQDFKKVAIGKASMIAVATTSGLFAASHPEWLPALITGLLWAWLVWKTKSVSACVISHAVANLTLGLYVVATGEWRYL